MFAIINIWILIKIDNIFILLLESSIQLQMPMAWCPLFRFLSNFAKTWYIIQTASNWKLHFISYLEITDFESNTSYFSFWYFSNYSFTIIFFHLCFGTILTIYILALLDGVSHTKTFPSLALLLQSIINPFQLCIYI